MKKYRSFWRRLPALLAILLGIFMIAGQAVTVSASSQEKILQLEEEVEELKGQVKDYKKKAAKWKKKYQSMKKKYQKLKEEKASQAQPGEGSFVAEQRGSLGTTQASQADAGQTPGMRNALREAQTYLQYSAFSYTGLIGQLEYSGYSHEDAVYAANNCGADWMEQAVKSANTYLEYSSFSLDGLIGQLEYEGYTHEEAVYGANTAYNTY